MKNLINCFIAGSFILVITPADATNAIVIKNLNFRIGPSTQHPLLGWIPVNQAVSIRTCRGNWCQIDYNSRTGWVSSRYLSFKNGNDLYQMYIKPSIRAHTPNIKK
ncbi:SH3 domain-containing protein [Bartonella sp. AR 15-3]|uniref:SH3 domain-containing protein n=1 Tax=Bartonella sp. AR 15-3 TaxID=545617 RepID=UPI00099956A7|nr:SH3 domain-containing protein [Bartonella sp. AR 15-3]